VAVFDTSPTYDAANDRVVVGTITFNDANWDAPIRVGLEARDDFVREDAQVLYGFATLEERAAFRELIRISGVGARTALAVLSGMSVAELAHAVVAQETGRLVKVPGIGKKTAERLLLELKGRLAQPLSGTGAIAPARGDAADILNALVALGYSEKEAGAALKGLAPGLGVAEGIRAALKALAKS